MDREPIPDLILSDVFIAAAVLKRFNRSAEIPARTGAKAAAACGRQKCQGCEWRCFRSRNDC
jgi:hypothetical protein